MPRLLTTVRDGLAKGLSLVYPNAASGQYGGFGERSWLSSLPGSSYDYEAEAGRVWQNNIVAAAISWKQDVFPEAPLAVYKSAASGRDQMVRNHPLTQLMRRPNKEYSGAMLWKATVLSLDVDGNSYWVKIRSGAGKVVELWWVPWFLMEPRWHIDGSDYIAAYEYRVNGKSYWFLPDDVVHLRRGIDPENTRKGMSRTRAVLREICTANESSAYDAALMRNMGLVGLILTPKTGSSITADQGKRLKELIKEEYTGDSRFGVFGTTLPVDVASPGFSPEQMALDKIKRFPVDFICANLGIDPMVIGLPSESKTYSNYAEAKRAAYESTIIPSKESIADELDIQLLPEFSLTQRDFVGWDYRNVRCLQEDMDKLYKRNVEVVKEGVLTPNEARANLGYAPVEGGDDLRSAETVPGEMTDTEDDEADDSMDDENADEESED